MQTTTRFAIQFADGTLARNCSGVRTSKTAALAQAHVAATVRNSRKLLARPRAYWQRQGYSESGIDKMLIDAAAIVARYETATVVTR